MFAARNLLLTPKAAAVVTYDATGTGDNSGSSNVQSLAWTHTATSGAYVVASVMPQLYGTVSTITYGGTAMTLLGSLTCGNAGALDGTLYLYGLASAPSGAQTVAVTFPAVYGPAIGNSVSYKNVAAISAPVTSYGNSASVSNALTCTLGQMIMNAFGGSDGPFTSPSGGTTRYSGGTSANCGMLIQDATASATFTATMVSSQWAGIGLSLSPSPGPAYDATGAGSTGSNATWSHTAGASATAVIVGITAASSVTGVTWGGTAMTLLNSITSSPDVYLYGLLNPATGTKTVAVTGGGNAAANSVSYTGVTSFGTTATNTSAGTSSASVSVSSVPTQMAAVVFGSSAQPGSFSSFNQTSRYSQAGSPGGSYAAVIGDAAGASTVSFTATSPNTTWGAVAVPLV